MSTKTWIDLAITLGWLIVAIGAAVYGKYKAKINKATAAGKAITIVGELATFAVQEAEKLGTDGDSKKQFAVEAVTQALGFLGLKNITPIMVQGAVEDAVKGMKLADQALESKEEK